MTLTETFTERGRQARRAAAPVLVLMLCLLGLSACGSLPTNELEALGSGITPQSVNFAELAVDELVELTGIDEERAKELILKARAHWFE